MKNNLIIPLKVNLFKIFKPIEKVLAYNRIRRDGWISIQAKKYLKSKHEKNFVFFHKLHLN